MLKRLFDIVASFLILVLSFPLLLFLSIFILLILGNPIFFTQTRPGLNGEPFRMIKFRTMTNEMDKNGNLLSNEERKTQFGNFLRSASIDEMPELINVLKGDMSLVGPRPLLMDYLPYFTKEQQRRHEVKPGITGWAQINGRNAIEWDEKLALDIWYVDHNSIWLDLKILFLTFLKVFKREGINYEGHISMPRFDEAKKRNDN